MQINKTKLDCVVLLYYDNGSKWENVIYGNNSSTKLHVNSLRKYLNDLKESLEFSQMKYDDKLKNMGDKVQKLKEEVYLMTQELHIIQAIKLLYAIEIKGP